MRIEVCVKCRRVSMTSRRKGCICKACGLELVKMPVLFERWCEMGNEEREECVSEFIEKREIERQEMEAAASEDALSAEVPSA